MRMFPYLDIKPWFLKVVSVTDRYYRIYTND